MFAPVTVAVIVIVTAIVIVAVTVAVADVVAVVFVSVVAVHAGVVAAAWARTRSMSVLDRASTVLPARRSAVLYMPPVCQAGRRLAGTGGM